MIYIKRLFYKIDLPAFSQIPMKMPLKKFLYAIAAMSLILMGCETTEDSKKASATTDGGGSTAVVENTSSKGNAESSTTTEELKKAEQEGGHVDTPVVVAEASPTESSPASPKSEVTAQEAVEASKESVEVSKEEKAEEPMKESKVEEVTPAPTAKPKNPKYVGMVMVVNSKKNFVVVDFGENMPAVKSELGVYRYDVFIGSIRVTEPVKAPLATADILNGTLKKGDEVR